MADAGGCGVRWYYSHHLKFQKRGGNFYTDYGTMLHSVLAYHYAEQMERKPQWFIDNPSMLDAIEQDAMGHPDWVRNALAFHAAYKLRWAGDPWVPLYCEEEFEATVGALDPEGEDEPEEDIEYTDSDGEKQVYHLPRLNEEVVTCRPDLIIRHNEYNWIIDHKSQGAARNGTDKLPVINDEYPDYTYYWQAMVNMHIVRQKLDVEGFIFNRVKRDFPFDFARDLFSMPDRMYVKVPKVIRSSVKRERVLMRQILAGKPPEPSPWECQGKWQCPYVRLCYADSVEARNLRANTEFFVEV